MKTLLAQESKFGGQMTKCKSDDQHVFLISNGVLTVVNIYYFLHQCLFCLWQCHGYFYSEAFDYL